MPYLPPRLVQTDVLAPYTHLVHYNGYGSASSGFEQLPGESDADYYLRLTRQVLPTVSQLVKGKSPAEEIAILESRIAQATPLVGIPVIGNLVSPLIDEWRRRIAALKPQAQGDDLIQKAKVAGAIIGAIGVSGFALYQLVRWIRTVKQE